MGKYLDVKNRPYTPGQIHIGGVYHIRQESEYEAFGYKTDILMPARNHMVLVIGNLPGKLEYWRIHTMTSDLIDLAISQNTPLNSRYANFLPFCPVEKGDFAMQLRLENGMKFRGLRKSYLRFDREFWIHECGLVEMPDRKTGVHFRLSLEGEGGMKECVKVFEERKELVKCLESGAAWEGTLLGFQATT